MSYNPVFTEFSSIKAMTGEEIDDTSSPTSAQVLQWIEEVEQDMIGKGYNTQALTDVIMDVPEGEPGEDINLLQRGLIYSTRYYSQGKVVTLPHSPFVSVANIKRNVAGYTETPDWEDLTEGPGSGTHFIIVKGSFKQGLRGISLYFYENAPYSGIQKMKLDYTWGYELPPTVLRDFATCKVSLMFLYAKYLRKEPVFDVDVAGMKTKLNPFTKVHEFILEKLEAIRTEWLPNEWVSAALKP